MELHMTTNGKTPGISESQERHSGDVVPVPIGSSSSYGPPEELPTRSSGEFASVRVESSSRKDNSSSSARSVFSAGNASVLSVSMSEGREEAKRPGDWVPVFLPRYTELIDRSMAWEEYYDKVWQLEEVVTKNELDKKKWRKEREEWRKEKRKMDQELDHLELSILTMKELEKSEKDLKEEVDELREELQKGKVPRRIAWTQTGSTLEKAHIGGRMGQVEEKVGKMEEEIKRMSEAVTLLAQTISLLGDRLTGEMTTIRSCAHAQCLIRPDIVLRSVFL